MKSDYGADGVIYAGLAYPHAAGAWLLAVPEMNPDAVMAMKPVLSSADQLLGQQISSDICHCMAEKNHSNGTVTLDDLRAESASYRAGQGLCDTCGAMDMSMLNSRNKMEWPLYGWGQ